MSVIHFGWAKCVSVCCLTQLVKTMKPQQDGRHVADTFKYISVTEMLYLDSDFTEVGSWNWVEIELSLVSAMSLNQINKNLYLIQYLSRFCGIAYVTSFLKRRHGYHVTRGNRCMIMSSDGNIFHVTGHLCGEFTGSRWSPHTRASDAELWCLLWSAPE